MKCYKVVLVSMFVLLALASCSYVYGHSVSVVVVKENGRAVKDAQVTMVFNHLGRDNVKKDRTNDDGIVSMRGDLSLQVDVEINKKGFYKSERTLVGEEDHRIEMILRKRKNPISMYVKEKVVQFPKKGEKIGFDFKEGDWVVPEGEGSTAHVYFLIEGVERGANDGEGRLLVEFPGEKGGIRSPEKGYYYSTLKFPHKAPKSGYSKRLVHKYSQRPEEGGRGYTRTDTLESGKIGYVFKSVMQEERGSGEISFFGKILGEVDFTVGEFKNGSVGALKFTYYFNPTPNDRNIEFDPGRNLFENPERSYPP